MAHGNGPNGLNVLQAALAALERLDREHAAVYFQIIWNALREPMKRALEARAMEQQADGTTSVPAFVQDIFERGFRQGEQRGELRGEQRGEQRGRLMALRDALLKMATLMGFTLSDAERAQILTCEDLAKLDRWIENVGGAKTAADVFR